MVNHNTILSSTNYSYYRGIEMYSVGEATRILGNEIYANDADGFGIHLQTSNGVVGSEGLIANNVIQIGSIGIQHF